MGKDAYPSIPLGRQAGNMNLNVRVKAAHLQRDRERVEFLMGLGDVWKQNMGHLIKEPVHLSLGHNLKMNFILVMAGTKHALR